MIAGFDDVEQPVPGFLRFFADAGQESVRRVVYGLVDIAGDRSIQLSWFLSRSRWRRPARTFSAGVWTFEGDRRGMVVDGGAGRRELGPGTNYLDRKGGILMMPQLDALAPLRNLPAGLVEVVALPDGVTSFARDPVGHRKPGRVDVLADGVLRQVTFEGSEGLGHLHLRPAARAETEIFARPWPPFVPTARTDDRGRPYLENTRAASSDPPPWAAAIGRIDAAVPPRKL